MEDRHARVPKRGAPKASSKPPAAFYPNPLWAALPDEDRRQTLTTLSQIVAKRLRPPSGVKEVPHDDR
jgi:hypothetical protein